MNPVIHHRMLLALLTCVFAVRVAAQYVLQYNQISFLPGFDLWHSSTMAYPTLLTVQAIVLIAMTAGIGFALPKVSRPVLGASILVIGWTYGAAMVVRLILGSFDLVTHPWLDGAVSTAFHFVLTAYLLVFGSAIKGAWRDGKIPPNSALTRYLAYPALMAGGYLLFSWLVKTGSPMLFSAYLSVFVSVIGIVLHETFAPDREEWRPNAHDLLSDGVFLTVIQIGLPALMKVLALMLIVKLAQSNEAPFHAFWPGNAPLLAQVMLMMLVAEFFRYWLHRTLHRNKTMWKLHAVHHAAEKLYTINVGRFHPFDKALQFLGDTLPFLLLGVSAEVFAVYFVVYAVNGFYQHSNSDIRLGPLNWIVAGPELHRWHHSAKVSEAHANYGNNLIIWDTIFGTRFLPNERRVARVGIGNTKWPSGFFQQLTAPFTTSTETTPKSEGS